MDKYYSSITVDRIMEKTDRLSAGDVLRVTGPNGKQAYGEIVGIYPYIIRFRDVNTNLSFTLPRSDVYNAVMAMSARRDRTLDELAILNALEGGGPRA